MRRLPSVVLASTLHDPDGRYLEHLTLTSTQLENYIHVVVAFTRDTSRAVTRLLQAAGAHTMEVDSRQVGTARREAVRAAHAVSEMSPIFACDFDRWLHWASTYPGELRDLPRLITEMHPELSYVCIGRTRRAFASHPLAQQEPEAATNHALSLVVGHEVDAVAGAAWLSPAGAEIVLQGSTELTAATDLEWPALVFKCDPKGVGAMAVDGLEFETATFHQDEVLAAGGRQDWIKAKYDRPVVWEQRLRLAADSVAAMNRVLYDT
jgi:hypothetical protein